MKRLELLSVTATENVTLAIADISAANFERKVAREKENLEFELVKLKNELKQSLNRLEDRLSSEETITSNDVKLSYSPISKKKEEIKDLEDFITSYYSESETK